MSMVNDELVLGLPVNNGKLNAMINVPVHGITMRFFSRITTEKSQIKRIKKAIIG